VAAAAAVLSAVAAVDVKILDAKYPAAAAALFAQNAECGRCCILCQ